LLADRFSVRVGKMPIERCQAVLPGAVFKKIDREVKMKLAISSIALFTLAFSPVTFAQAETCNGRAQACMVKWGSPRAACFEQFRLAACEKTGKYVAPNGNVWPASRVQRKINVES
jgi:hypothetical protein